MRRAISDTMSSSSSDDGRDGEENTGGLGTANADLPGSRSPICHIYLENDPDGIAHGEETNEFEAALLVTGTAVGGGSLALPYFCAAGGFFPAVGLLLVGPGRN